MRAPTQVKKKIQMERVFARAEANNIIMDLAKELCYVPTCCQYLNGLSCSVLKPLLKKKEVTCLL